MSLCEYSTDFSGSKGKDNFFIRWIISSYLVTTMFQRANCPLSKLYKSFSYVRAMLQLYPMTQQVMNHPWIGRTKGPCDNRVYPSGSNWSSEAKRQCCIFTDLKHNRQDLNWTYFAFERGFVKMVSHYCFMQRAAHYTSTWYWNLSRCYTTVYSTHSSISSKLKQNC